jgi:Icc protein
MLIAQITDTHIVARGQHWLGEPRTQTETRLKEVVKCLNQLSPQPEVILLTGDLTNSGTEDAYDHLKELLRPLKAPYLILPGNHDNREQMRHSFNHHSYLPKRGYLNYVVDDFPIQLIGLDTLDEGKDSGLICAERFQWLSEVLNREQGKPQLIFMHHPSTKVGTKLFDSILCKVPEEFNSLISGRKQLLGILAGHYHYFCATSIGNKPCFIAPSVAPAYYFANPATDDHPTALELQPAAITLHSWDGAGLTSRIEYLGGQFVNVPIQGDSRN